MLIWQIGDQVASSEYVQILFTGCSSVQAAFGVLRQRAHWGMKSSSRREAALPRGLDSRRRAALGRPTSELLKRRAEHIRVENCGNDPEHCEAKQ
jgi:hypothetical protein